MKKWYFLAVLSALVLLYSGCVVENEEPPRPVELVISEQPAKVEYKKGDELDLSGLEVTLKKSDGTSEVLEKGKYTAVPSDGTVLAEPGKKTVTITAEGLSATFTITVTATKRLEISKQPTKVGYEKGDKLDLSGLEVTLHKADGTSELLTEYKTVPEEGTELTASGEKTVIVTAEGLSATFTITVTAPEGKPDEPTDRLEISKQPTKVGYEKGDKLDLSGLEVTLHKADGTSEVLKAYTTEPENGSELTRLGKQPVAIMAEGLETTFDICVAGLEILQLPKTDYTFYVPLDLSGLEIKRYNTDGTSEVLEQYATEPEDKSILAEIGKPSVIITAGELTETFEISVSDEYVVVDDVSDEYVVVGDNGNHILMNVPAKVKEKAGKITVPESIVEIGGTDTYFTSNGEIFESTVAEPVFDECGSNLTEIKLMGGIKRVCSRAFEGFSGEVKVARENSFFSRCKTLQRVVIEDGVTKTPLFSECRNLTSTKIPRSVTSIGEKAFWGCSSLASVEIPSSVASIGDSAFRGCSSLKSVEIPSSVTSIGEEAFSGCESLTSVKIPSSVTFIGRFAFGYCSSLASVEIPSSVTSIMGWAFSSCKSLTSVKIPSSVTFIGRFAFGYCSRLESVEIPSSVTSIEYCAFKDCSSLKSVNYGGLKEQWNEIKVIFLDSDGNVGVISEATMSEKYGVVGLEGKKIVCADDEIIQY